MAEREASDTALGVAVLRAVHQMIDGKPKILNDPVMVQMLDEETRSRIQNQPEIYQLPHSQALRSRVLLRSRFAEDRLAEAVTRGIRQFVLLGAGMDTFAYRQPNWANELQIFEVDHPASQSAKRHRLKEFHIPIPPNLEYVEADLEKESVGSALEHSRFDFNQPAFFSCLGVLMYLTETAVDSLLSFVASMPPSSEIVFTFANDNPNHPSLIERSAEALGEPWLTKFQPEDLKEKLRHLGFSGILFLTPEMIAERYMQDRQDGLPVPRKASIVSARM